MGSRPTVTVVVCTHDRPDHLRNCLASLARQSYSHFDIVVVESGRARSAREISLAHGVAYLHEPVAGISRARNAGVRAAGGEIVAFIDDDAMAEAGWLESLIQVFVDSSVGAATGGTRYMKSYGEDRFMSADIAQEHLRPYRTFGRGEDDWFASACFGGIGDGMNMAFRRSLLAHRIRFDERLGRGCLLNGGDEHVAFVLVLAMGFRISHVPAAMVRHPAPADARQVAVRRMHLMCSSIAYMLFLWFEFPAHRSDLVRFVRRAVRKRLAAPAPGTAALERFSSWHALRALLLGPIVYLRARRSWKTDRSVARRAPQAGVRQPRDPQRV